jgi:hypothetical protein
LEGNGELARDGNDHDALNAPATVDLAGNLPGEPWRQGPSLSGHQHVDLERLVARLHVDAANALGKQQSLDGVISSRVWFRKERPLRDNALSFDAPIGCVGQVGCVAVCPHRKLALANLPYKR